jgi:hypothetical protein
MPIYMPPPILVYLPPPTPATLSTSLPSSLSSLIPFVSLLNAHVLFVPPFVSLPTMSQSLLLVVPFLYITPLPSPSSLLPTLSGLPSPPHVAAASLVAPAPPLVMAAGYNP